MSISQEDARSLAVAYEAYCDCLREAYEGKSWGAWNSVAVWGDILIRAQRKTGVILRKEEGLKWIIEDARSKRDELPPIAA